jgi:molecular chaperone DnaK
VHDAVITVPGYFREPQRRATEDAAHLARLNVRRLINEPTAAAVSFGADEVQTCAVYDLGGGTFDVSVIQVRPGNVTVVGTGGDPHLGGNDFDERVASWAVGEIRRIYGVDLGGDGMARRRILREAERRKRELSTATATALALPYLTRDISTTIPLTRTVFEGLIADLLKHSLLCLDEALESARERHGIERGEVSQVLLVGGSTRIAKVRPMPASHFGMELRDIRGDTNPDEAVVRGAGMVARDCPYAAGYLGSEIELPP